MESVAESPRRRRIVIPGDRRAKEAHVIASRGGNVLAADEHRVAEVRGHAHYLENLLRRHEGRHSPTLQAVKEATVMLRGMIAIGEAVRRLEARRAKAAAKAAREAARATKK